MARLCARSDTKWYRILENTQMWTQPWRRKPVMHNQSKSPWKAGSKMQSVSNGTCEWNPAEFKWLWAHSEQLDQYNNLISIKLITLEIFLGGAMYDMRCSRSVSVCLDEWWWMAFNIVTEGLLVHLGLDQSWRDLQMTNRMELSWCWRVNCELSIIDTELIQLSECCGVEYETTQRQISDQQNNSGSV